MSLAAKGFLRGKTKKAETEYKKYQTASLAPVEKAYLNSVKMLEKKVKSDKKRAK